MVKTAAIALVGTGLAGCGGDGEGGGGDGNGDDGGASGDPPSFDGFFDDTSNYAGVTDETGASEVAVDVGSRGNGGSLAYDPPAIRVDAGTTVVWEWTGEGGFHDVVAEDGSFESDQTDEAGHTFSHAFDASGTVKYACTPHRALGMRGVVVVE